MGIYDVIGHVIGHVTCRSCPRGHVTGYVIDHVAFPVIYRVVKSGDDHIWENWDEIPGRTPHFLLLTYDVSYLRGKKSKK